MMSRLLQLLTVSLLLSAPANAEWREVETSHFIIVSESPPEEIEEFATRLESYDKLMRMATGIDEDEPVKVRIYEVDGTGDIETALGVNHTGIAGFYDNNSIGPYAVTPRKTRNTGKYFTPALVLHHEYAHHFMLQYFPAMYPGWYVEGFAELIGSSQPLGDGKIGYGMPAKHRGNEIAAYWVPLTELLTQERVKFLDTYAQGWAVTHFMTFDKARSAQFRRYLAAIGNGKSYAEAAKVFGDLNQLNRDARRYVTAGTFEYKAVQVDVTKPVIKHSRVMSEGEVAMIPNLIAYRDDELSVYKKAGAREREADLRDANLRKIRDKAARYASEPLAQYLLAEAEFAAGNHVQAEAAVDRLLALSPKHVRGMARKSLLLSQAAARLSGQARAAKANEARNLAIQANKINKDDPLPLLAFYQSFNLAGEKPSPIAFEGLLQASSLLPRDDRIRQLVVDQLARDRRYDEAMAWLVSLSNSPHESPRREAARAQMEQLRAAKAAARQADETKTAEDSKS